MLARTHRDPSVALSQARSRVERIERKADNQVCRFCHILFTVDAVLVLAWLSVLCYACFAT